MDINGVPAALSSYESSKTKTKGNVNPNSSEDSTNTGNNSEESQSAVYEKSSSDNQTKKTYKQDTATIVKLKADADRRYASLRSLVEKMFNKQGKTFDEANMFQLLREGKVPVDAETAAQAQKDIAEDGYWGVNQTSDRLVSFAKALAGSDPEKADEMIDAVKKGFEEATKTWGDDLPDICKQTLDATLKKLDEWKNSVSDESDSKSK
jgi:hypothetical protein